MSVKIGNEDWTFEQIAGTQVVDDEGGSHRTYAHCHHDRHVVTITKSLPPASQLELAAKIGAQIMDRQVSRVRFIGDVT